MTLVFYTLCVLSQMTPRDRIEHDFVRDQQLPVGFHLFGPNVVQMTQFTLRGLEFRIPGGKSQDVRGISTQVALSGDFDILVQYEWVNAPAQMDGKGSAIKLWLTFASLERTNASAMHRIGTGRDMIVATLGGREDTDNLTKAIKVARSNRHLRIRRIGSRLVFSHSPNDQSVIYECACPEEDVSAVRVAVLPGSSQQRAGVTIRSLSLASNRNTGAPNRPGPRFSLRHYAIGGAIATLLAVLGIRLFRLTHNPPFEPARIA
jgi:hypothetical protein